MDFNTTNAKALLEQFEFRRLFTEELGWDRHNAHLTVTVSGTVFDLKAVAEKRGAVAWICSPQNGQGMPDRVIRQKIDREVAKITFEHLVVFVDSQRNSQVWAWPRRELGKPVSLVDHLWRKESQNTPFVQRLQGISFRLNEENELTLPKVTARLQSTLNAEKVTKRFFDDFTKQHKTFLGFINGITNVADKEWYVSLMLNRLMFIYFMQRKGFLNGETDYLRDRLTQFQREKGKDRFYSFYRYFLLRLFHEGLGAKARNPELDKLLGRIPYLNGGLFEKHSIEERCPDIAIPDKAFENIFAYFDRYQWHLDERPLRNDNEINPDVLGYIFEKYINQKQMGAYYTKEDITEYISKNTVIPFLFDAAKRKCKVAFDNPGGPTVWDHLRDDPDRYIYAAVKHGVELPLPANIAAGIFDVAARSDWNRTAPSTFGLPSEIWREVVARRMRHAEVRAKLATGEVKEIHDLITLNLDIRQFAQDVIERCEGPDLLRAFWKSIESVTVLDPTCGSGAFLFAALEILEPLYATCLDRMEAFVADRERSSGRTEDNPKGFREVLKKIEAHPNTRYFILKSIILNNLFGVDIMEEAVEICKLRLFLKLAAQVDPNMKADNLGVEPLPDIDFNIRTGNTLVGYATYAEVEASANGDWIRQQELEKIKPRAADLQQAFDVFRARQVQGDGSVPAEDKAKLRQHLRALESELNLQVAKGYGVKTNQPKAYQAWLQSHQPFHWFIEYHGIMQSGGFDVIVGNPPYLEVAKLKGSYSVKGYKTQSTANLYSLCSERSMNLLRKDGMLSLIIPLSMFATPNMRLAQNLIINDSSALWVSYYSNRPAQLFEGAQNFLSIFISQKKNDDSTDDGSCLFTTKLYRWASHERSNLFQLHDFTEVDRQVGLPLYAYPKFSNTIENSISRKLFSKKRRLSDVCRDTGPAKNWAVYCYGGVYWTKARNFESPVLKDGIEARSSADREFYTDGKVDPLSAVSLINSGLHFWFWTNFSDCRNKTYSVVLDMPIDAEKLERDEMLASLGQSLMVEYRSNAVRKVRDGKRGRTEFDEFYPKKSKCLLDSIDRVLATHYDFSKEELEFILNYEIKYRLGADDEDEGEE